MHNINDSDNVVVIEEDPLKLDVAIRVAQDEACGVLRTHYLSEYNTVPPIQTRVSSGKAADNYKNGAHVVFHILSPPSNVTLLTGYVELLEQILRAKCRGSVIQGLIREAAFGSIDIINRCLNLEHYGVVFHHAARAFFVSLLRQGVVLLPADMGLFLPFEFGVWRGFELMPERLIDMATLYYAMPHPRLKTLHKTPATGFGVDWNLCTYQWNGASIKDRGIEQIPAKESRAAMVHLAMSTRWESLLDIDPAEIDELKSLIDSTTSIGLYLTYLYLKLNGSQKLVAAKKIFPWLDRIPFVRLYVEEFENSSKRMKNRRNNIKRQEAGLIREAYLTEFADRDRRSFEECLNGSIAEVTKEDGRVDPILLARSLGRMRRRTTLRPNNILKNTVLPNHIQFDFANKTTHWYAGFSQYRKMTGYADVDNEFNAFVPFMHYLTVYLPIYFSENPESDASYPARIEELNGFKFISRPVDEGTLDLNLPITYLDFAKEYYSQSRQTRFYTAMRKLQHFFEVILRRRELLSIPYEFQNPVLPTDIPGTGGRHLKSVKERLPRKVYWLTLLYAYKIYDYVSIINQKCLDDALYASEYSKRHHNLDRDELGLIDIRDILGDDEANRMIKFEDVEKELNFVPAYFFDPVELPLKGKGIRYLLRPHLITHLICALETGIRNQHIQWLSYDFDKKVGDKVVNTEDVYQLFVMTDKSNKSWIACTAGRVIKILREIRIFRDLIDIEFFNDKLFYEGRKENNVYPPFKVLFAFNPENGSPYSDNTYDNAFRHMLIGAQHVLDDYGIEYQLFDVDEQGQSQHDRIRLRTNLSPHSMRVTVVSELVTFLNSEYVGRYITNQKLATVWYYTKYDAEHLRKLQEEQAKVIAQLDSGKSEFQSIGDGGVKITTDVNSMLAKAFREDPDNAVVDFGAVSPHFFDRPSAIAILLSNTNLTLAFERTYICPYNRICPRDLHKVGLAYRCNVCDYAIRTVEHLPAIGCLRRDLLDELERLEGSEEINEKNMSKGELQDIDSRISVIAEDLANLDLVEQILQENLRQLQEDQKNRVFHVYTPTAVLQNLEAVPFPDKNNEVLHLLARLSETHDWPDDRRQTLHNMCLRLSFLIRANTCDVRDWYRRGGDINHVEAELWSMVHSFAALKGYTLDKVVEVINRSIQYFVASEPQNNPLLLTDGVAEFRTFLGQAQVSA